MTQKKLSFVIFFFLILFVLFVSGRLLLPLDSKGQRELVDIPAGTSFYKLAEDLESKKIIKRAWDFKLLVKIFGEPPLPKGEYELSSGKSLWELFQILKKGEDKSFLVHFPEGLNHYEMAQVLKSHNWPASETFLQEVWNKKLMQKLLKQSFPSFEGYLFPDSYRIKKYMKAEDLIETMSQQFLKVYSQLSNSYPKKDMSRHQIVTFASLIEKETGQALERPLISGVFYNRLQKNMKLQTDPSILYALYLVRGFGIKKNIRKKDILFPSPYNTYTIKGLPPGPIANPGEKSLQAVFQPEKSEYLYFVSRNDGSHHFSKTYKEHQKAVYKYQIVPFQKKHSSE